MQGAYVLIFILFLQLYILFPPGNLVLANFESLFFGQDFQACVSPILNGRLQPYCKRDIRYMQKAKTATTCSKIWGIRSMSMLWMEKKMQSNPIAFCECMNSVYRLQRYKVMVYYEVSKKCWTRCACIRQFPNNAFVLQFSRKFQISIISVFPFYITKEQLIHLIASLTSELMSKLFPAMTQ